MGPTGHDTSQQAVLGPPLPLSGGLAWHTDTVARHSTVGGTTQSARPAYIHHRPVPLRPPNPKPNLRRALKSQTLNLIHAACRLLCPLQSPSPPRLPPVGMSS
jgi:hypothetical protein